MKFTSTELQALLQSIEFQTLPEQLAQLEPATCWQEHMEAVMKYGVELLVWESAHRISNFLETYPENTGFKLLIQEDPETKTVDFTPIIDDVSVFDWLTKEAIIGRMGQHAAYYQNIDEMKLFQETFTWFHEMKYNHPIHQLLYQSIEKFQKAFDLNHIKPEDARAIAMKYAPTIEACVRNKMLTAQTPGHENSEPTIIKKTTFTRM